MSTLSNLVANDKLVPGDVLLDSQELPKRVLYMTPSFRTWMGDTLRGEPLDRDTDLYPEEQAELILRQYLLGQPMAYSSTLKQLESLPY
jgi:hypothetical protein